jgi:hypothetical protein
MVLAPLALARINRLEQGVQSAQCLRRCLVPAPSHQDCKYLAVLGDSAPEIVALPIDRQTHLSRCRLSPRRGCWRHNWLAYACPNI